MVYLFLYPLHELFFGFNIFRYITFRASMALVTSFLLSIILGPWLIKKLSILKIGQNVRKEESKALYDLQRHKEGTPTMGGILIIFSILVSVFLWADLKNKFVILTSLTCIWLGVIGFFDDYLKLRQKSSKGLPAALKLFGQLILAIFIGFFLYSDPTLSTQIDFPFFKSINLDIGILYILLVSLIIVGSSNAVNLTDGLDGLAIGCVLMVAFTLSILSYISGHAVFSNYLLITHIPGAGELAIFSAAVFGASLGFLWFNCYPATVFMGDVGSLALGGTLGVIAVFIKKELLLGILGGIFVIEALSVILQVGSFKLRRKRIFKMSPLHHHFQMLGWNESKVIVRFWIIAIILALLTITTLKIR